MHKPLCKATLCKHSISEVPLSERIFVSRSAGAATFCLRKSFHRHTMQTTMNCSCNLSQGRVRQPFQAAHQPRPSCTATRPASASAQRQGARPASQQSLAGRTCGLAAFRRSQPCSRASLQQGLAVRAEISYVMIKPDGVQRNLVGEVLLSVVYICNVIHACHSNTLLQAAHNSRCCSQPFGGGDGHAGEPCAVDTWMADNRFACCGNTNQDLSFEHSTELHLMLHAAHVHGCSCLHPVWPCPTPCQGECQICRRSPVASMKKCQPTAGHLPLRAQGLPAGGAEAGGAGADPGGGALQGPVLQALLPGPHRLHHLRPRRVHGKMPERR